jgi:hypothetical protein
MISLVHFQAISSYFIYMLNADIAFKLIYLISLQCHYLVEHMPVLPLFQYG